MQTVTLEATENGHKRRQALRRADIISAATSLFFDKGYGRTTMDDVLQKVGGSKRTLYQHFHGKDDLFTEIVRNVSSRVLAQFTFQFQGEFRESLQALGVRYLEILLLPETLALYRAVLCESPFFPELANTFFENGPDRVTRGLKQFFESHNAKGIIRIRAPELTARQFVGMLRGDHHLASALGLKTPSSRQINEIVRQAVETLIEGAVEHLPNVEGKSQSRKRIGA